MINILYGILMGTKVTASSYYTKTYTPVHLTYDAKQLRDSFLDNIPTDRLPLFACYICNAVQNTCFGAEIKQLDANNTYHDVVRNPGSTGIAADVCLWDLTQSAKVMRKLYKWLDADILDQLVVPEWIEIVAAVCLQLLREVA